MKTEYTLEELKHLRNLNVELIEAVAHTAIHLLEYAEKHKIPLPNETGLINLLGHVRKVIREINDEVATLHVFSPKSRRVTRIFFLNYSVWRIC
jgi:hypothetical protein